MFRPPLLQTKPEEITGSDGEKQSSTFTSFHLLCDAASIKLVFFSFCEEVENSDLKRMRKGTDYRSVSNGRCAGKETKIFLRTMSTFLLLLFLVLYLRYTRNHSFFFLLLHTDDYFFL